MKRSARIVAALFCVPIVLSACTPARVTMLRKHPEITQRSQHLQRIAIVPPQLTVAEQRLTEASERLRDMEEQLRPRIVDRVSSLLLQRGFALVPAQLDDSDLGDDYALRLALTRLRGESAHLASRLYWKGAILVADANQVQVTIGPIVNRFADRAGADAIVVLRGAVTTKSAGMRQKDTFFQILAALAGAYRPQPVAGGWIDLQLIDGTSGDLLWANRGWAVFYREIDIDFLMNQVLNDFDLWRPAPAADGAAELPQPAVPAAAPDDLPPS